MMKQEFEQMIGKEVTYETFRIYEEMYCAAPESVTKQKFVEMLNIAAIPESEEAIERRKSNEARKQEIRSKIDELKQSLKWLKEKRAMYREWSKGANGSEWKKEVKIKDRQIERYQAEIAELEFVIA